MSFTANSSTNRRRFHSGFQRLFALGLLVCLLGVTPLASAERVRRFALVLGANQGGHGRTNLHYATRDADLVARVLTHLGGVSHEDLIVLRDVTAVAMETAWERLRVRLQKARDRGERAEVFFYYSGHSDEHGLLMRGKRIPYRKIREVIKSLPAEVRVAVLDSCASGVLTRGKGGLRGPPFLVDAATKVKGHAFVASASANEVAQESERLRGFFFTHHFVAGLRGAADADRDRRVTLSEAYQYAFNETLAHTESSRSGAQHANYDMRLVGSGGLVLTDLRATSALLVFGSQLQGQLYVRDEAGNLVVEVRKRGKRPLSLALDPGRYRVRIADGHRHLAGTFVLTIGGQAAVTRGALRESKALAHATKGPPPVFEPTHLLSAGYVGSFGHTSTGAFWDGILRPAIEMRFDRAIEQGFAHAAELRYLHRLGPAYLGLTAGYRYSEHVYRDADRLLVMAYPVHLTEQGDAHQVYALLSTEWHVPTWRWWQPLWVWRWIRPLIGLDVGGGYVQQRKHSSKADYEIPAGATQEEIDRMEGPRGATYSDNTRTRFLAAFHARLRVGLAVPVHERVRIEALGHLGFELSAAQMDDRDDRLEEVDPGSPFIPRLGFSVGVVLAL